ncbi:DUF3795 domain-containing protein [Anaerorhabdus furcosa]|uniref:DUF3795 domain-containing protein n=1 Tax=Anaerorhabdus furcosa TaxID=118967 RepID=A0A1T4JVP5_9FIRM|nr:DUF3795 domain-containing protein [Anaerorhabdus furcosa]SJZ34280.1 Protein of unknown function [Anaerorhabdus furcosa]
MIESRCGIQCSKCEFKVKVNCPGCTKIAKPFWADKCPVKSCCEDKGLENCGKCDQFPCKRLNDFAYDEKQGDNGQRIETCRKWCEVK